ncbi:hypothetical protein CIC12_24895 [Burkholderia sp. SG-MS1]|uniref:hypothetical protein n=1 Tax=Paraburkholderia sp. SG-MS1 TaxID=2023741 RepID=UPI0014461B05|nr:hypothetical protein [Paraburkholderia sp. SG-MS1]NKJ49913.1 hypothetical protein [Paraburkholderia sp. SG-MS1]
MNIFDVQKIDWHKPIFDPVRFPIEPALSQAIDDSAATMSGTCIGSPNALMLAGTTTSKKRAAARALNRRSE